MTFLGSIARDVSGDSARESSRGVTVLIVPGSTTRDKSMVTVPGSIASDGPW